MEHDAPTREEFESDIKSTSKLDYGFILFKQIDFVTRMKSVGNRHLFIQGVDAMHSLCCIYMQFDKDYMGVYESSRKTFAEKQSHLDPTSSDMSEEIEDLRYKNALTLWDEQLMLLCRKGVISQFQVTDYADEFDINDYK